MSIITKSSTHSIKFANKEKQHNVSLFLADYNNAVWFFVDYLWNNKIQFTDTRFLDIQNNKLDMPNYISTTDIIYQSDLSARAIKSASGTAIAIVKSQTSKRHKQLFVLKQQMKLGNLSGIKKLQSKIDSEPLTKPTKTSHNLFATLDSNCCTYIPTNNSFDGFLKLSALGKKYGTIYLPIKNTKHSNKFIKNGFKQITTWQISIRDVKSRWQVDRTKSTGTKILGADQGYTTCLSLSDGQVTKADRHGHDLSSIIQKMNKKKKGSNAFRKCQEHRTNYINWSINQLNLNNVKELRLEKLFQMRNGSSSSTCLSHWTYTAINAQVKSRCEDLGVPVIEQNAVYRSQRCSDCGWTQKNNRKRKEFICTSCGSVHDADINGALNHAVDLYQIPFNFRDRKLNKSGFFWKENGLFDSIGQDITVPDVLKVK